jgi:hypothetical protein
MGYHYPSYVDLLFIIEVDKCTSHELGVVVYDDRVHDPIPVYDLLDEHDYRLRASHSYEFRLDPLGKLVDHEKQVIKASGGGLEFPDEVESPNGEGPCNQDRLEFLGGDVLFLGKELSSLACTHNPFCIFDCSGPVNPLSKGFTYPSIWRCVVATSPRVDILQEFYPIIHGYASLHDSARAFVMDFIIPHDIGFGSPTYSISFIVVDGEDVVL